MASRFVKPQITRLQISGGDTIDVRHRLTAGEQQDLFAAIAPHMTAGEKVQLNSKSIMTAKILAYLLTWSLTDEGQPVPMSPQMSEADRLSTLRNLDPDTFAEIRAAIETHEDAVDKEIEERKKSETGLVASVAT